MEIEKVYIAYKKDVNKPPDLIVDGINLSKSGLTWFEDNIGWYKKVGELKVSKD